MTLPQQSSPIFFDLDSPYMERFRKLSTNSKDQNNSFRIELIQKDPKRNQTNKIPSAQLQRIDSVRQQKNSTIEPVLKKRYSEEKSGRKVMFHRQHTEPHQFVRQSTNPPPISHSNNQNVRKRLTSLQRYFQQTRSIKLPYRTQNRIHENEKFLTELDAFHASLSQVKKKVPQIQFGNAIEISNGKRNRFCESRPKKLKINDLQNENVKKEKEKILIQKIMKQRICQFRENLNHSQEIQDKLFERPIQLSVQIQNIMDSVQEMQVQIRHLKRLKKLNQQKMKEVISFLGFL